MKAIQDHISAKLFLSYAGVLLVGAVVLLFAVIFTAPGAYSRHMQMNPGDMIVDGTSVAVMPGMTHAPARSAGVNQSQGQGQGQGRGFGLGNGNGPGFGPGTGNGPGFNAFRAGVLESLGYAIIAVFLVAGSVSIIFSRQIVAPVRAMMDATQRVADGRYDERVNVSGSDELAQLGQRFNLMAERLENTESMRRQLIGDISHELRTPLTAIGGYMEALEDGVLPATPENFEQVRMEANRLSRLVDDLQELSRVESGSTRLELRPLKLPNLIATITKRLSHQFDEKKVSLAVGGSLSELPEVLADEDRMTQVITNLLANALIYTPSGGAVTISTVKNEAEIWISVKDTGIGISAENRAHIFDRFYRVDKSRSRAGGGGSGIGLTIAKAIVEAHNGRIWVESAGEDQGSTFTFSLPCA